MVEIAHKKNRMTLLLQAKLMRMIGSSSKSMLLISWGASSYFLVSFFEYDCRLFP